MAVRVVDEGGVVVDPLVRVGALDARIGTLAAQIHALETELVECLAEFDRLNGWQSHDFRSYAQWVSIRTKFPVSEARRLTSVAERLDRVPSLLEDARAGRVSVGMLGAAARVSTPENEERVADIVRDCTPSQAQRVLSKYRELAPTMGGGEGGSSDPAGDDGGRAAPEPEPDYWWRQWSDELGRGRVDGALDAATAALLAQAWKAAQASGEKERTAGGAAERGAAEDESDGRGDGGRGSGAGGSSTGRSEEPTPDERRRRVDPNEIARRLASTMLDAAHGSGLSAPNGERFSVQVTVDLVTLAQVLGLEFDSSLPVRLGSECFLADTGRHLDDAELAQILCDADVQVLVHAKGVPLWMGNEVRPFNRHQRRAMRHRSGGQGGCEFPGCTQTRFVEAHHVWHHGQHGPTCLSNGVLLCWWHHRRLHRDGWTVTTDGDQSFTFWDGTRCLGTTNRADRAGPGRPPDVARLPGIDEPPDAPPGIGPDTPLSTTGGERMTRWALDTYLHHLLAA